MRIEVSEELVALVRRRQPAQTRLINAATESIGAALIDWNMLNQIIAGRLENLMAEDLIEEDVNEAEEYGEYLESLFSGKRGGKQCS